MFPGMQLTGPRKFQYSIYVWINVSISWTYFYISSPQIISTEDYYCDILLKKCFLGQLSWGNVHAIWYSLLLTKQNNTFKALIIPSIRKLIWLFFPSSVPKIVLNYTNLFLCNIYWNPKHVIFWKITPNVAFTKDIQI